MIKKFVGFLVCLCILFLPIFVINYFENNYEVIQSKDTFIWSMIICYVILSPLIIKQIIKSYCEYRKRKNYLYAKLDKTNTFSWLENISMFCLPFIIAFISGNSVVLSYVSIFGKEVFYDAKVLELRKTTSIKGTHSYVTEIYSKEYGNETISSVKVYD